MLNPCELEIHLFCKGIRIGQSCAEGDGRGIAKIRAGLGSGLELIIPGPLKSISMNAPVTESFVVLSPFVLEQATQGYEVHDDTDGSRYPVRLAEKPEWYSRQTSSGVPMEQIGVLQGTYLGIYVGDTCGFWHYSPSRQCKFCTSGENIGVTEPRKKSIQDVVEVARAAKEESGVTFVHMNAGYHSSKSLDILAPYVKALKEQVGVLVGVQAIPSPDLWKYDWLIDLGANHFSFCYEFHNPEYFNALLPGKATLVGQQRFFDAMDYAAGKLPRGAVSGEIIAGVEPIRDTLQAIEFITDLGAFPTICVFRPVEGAMMEHEKPPEAEDMVTVMRHMYQACRRKLIPVGLAPNIEVSLIVNPDDARYLVPQDAKETLYRSFINTLRVPARMKFAYELRPRTIKADATSPAEYCKDLPQKGAPVNLRSYRESA